MSFLTTFFVSSLSFLSQDPTIRVMQMLLLAGGVVAIFLVFFTMRDVLLRTRSFLLQIFSIFLVALLPVVGFLLYLLIRPARTLKERELERLMRQLVEVSHKPDHSKKILKKEVKPLNAAPPLIATMTVTPPIPAPVA